MPTSGDTECCADSDINCCIPLYQSSAATCLVHIPSSAVTEPTSACLVSVHQHHTTHTIESVTIYAKLTTQKVTGTQVCYKLVVSTFSSPQLQACGIDVCFSIPQFRTPFNYKYFWISFKKHGSVQILR